MVRRLVQLQSQHLMMRRLLLVGDAAALTVLAIGGGFGAGADGADSVAGRLEDGTGWFAAPLIFIFGTAPAKSARLNLNPAVYPT